MIETEISGSQASKPGTIVFPLKFPEDKGEKQSLPETVTKPSLKTVLDKSQVKRDFTHYFAIFTWIGWTFFYFVLFFIGPFVYRFAPNFFHFLFFLIFLSAVLTNELSKQPKWAVDFGDWLMVKSAEYFHLKMVVEDLEAIETCGPAILAMEPHHILPLSIIAFHRKNIGFTGHNMLGCITGICFSVPLMRHIYKWVHADSVDKRNLKKMLQKNISPVLCPGGVQEAIYLPSDFAANKTGRKECVVYLKKRVGFIKLAAEFGVPVIPVFSFGLNQTFTFWKLDHPFLNKIGRKIGCLPMMFFGVWNLPLGPAKPTEYVNVIGKPIKTVKDANPSEAQLKEYQTLYIEEITRLFETYKTQYGMAEYDLKIM